MRKRFLKVIEQVKKENSEKEDEAKRKSIEKDKIERYNRFCGERNNGW